MNIFEELRADHEQQRSTIEKLVETSGDTEDRKRIFLKLKHLLEIHANAEERYFYSPLMKKDISQEAARHSVAEHKELDDYLNDLESMDMSSPAWLQTANKLKDRLLHHLKEEEREIFQVAGRALNEQNKEQLASQYRQDMNQNL